MKTVTGSITAAAVLLLALYSLYMGKKAPLPSMEISNAENELEQKELKNAALYLVTTCHVFQTSQGSSSSVVDETGKAAGRAWKIFIAKTNGNLCAAWLLLDQWFESIPAYEYANTQPCRCLKGASLNQGFGNFSNLFLRTALTKAGIPISGIQECLGKTPTLCGVKII